MVKFNLTVNDGCRASDAVLISKPSAISASITSQTNVLCFGNSTGSVTVAGSGGTPSYTYSLDGGPFQGSGTFSGLSSGSYTVTVKDANSCTFNQPVTITQPLLQLTASITAQANIPCFGDASGSVPVSGADGTPGYPYSLDGCPLHGSGTFIGVVPALDP